MILHHYIIIVLSTHYCSHQTLTCWPIMQKVRSYCFLNFIWAAYKTAISIISLTVLLTIAYISYLVLEEGSPFIQTDMHSILLFLYHLIINQSGFMPRANDKNKTFLFSLTLLKKSLLIYFPEVIKIFQFTSFILDIYNFLLEYNNASCACKADVFNVSTFLASLYLGRSLWYIAMIP